MKFDVVDFDGKKVSEIDLADSVFGAEPNEHLIYEVAKFQQINRRAGTLGVKNSSLVSGGGKKPWKQKGTGRARVGEIRNPLWRHGGTVFGPQPRSYDYALPKKVERGALRAALAQKFQEGQVVVVDQIAAAEIKTKAAVEMLKRLGVDGKAVLVDVAVDEKLSRSVRNIPGVEFVASARVTARQVMNAGRIVATPAALEKLQEALS